MEGSEVRKKSLISPEKVATTSTKIVLLAIKRI